MDNYHRYEQKYQIKRICLLQRNVYLWKKDKILLFTNLFQLIQPSNWKLHGCYLCTMAEDTITLKSLAVLHL